MSAWRHALEDSELDVVLRTDDPGLWAATYERLAFRPANYLASGLDYQLAYQKGHGDDCSELSCVLRSDGRAVGIWPLTIANRNGDYVLSSQGLPIMPPLFVKGCPPKTEKKRSVQCLRMASVLADQLRLSKWRSAVPFVEQAGISEWQLQAMSVGARCTVRHELYVDLQQSLAEIKSGFRKSYRALVTAGQRYWQIDILRAPGNESVWEEFRLLHAEVAGRVTRSLESWHLQHLALVADEAFLVVLRDGGGRMVGAGYFACSADEGVYAVGAYDRNLFDKPLGHIVQYKAIEELQRRGCRWYRIGARWFPGDEPPPKDKELAIASFKQGFASHVFPSFVLTHESTTGRA